MKEVYYKDDTKQEVSDQRSWNVKSCKTNINDHHLKQQQQQQQRATQRISNI